MPSTGKRTFRDEPLRETNHWKGEIDELCSSSLCYLVNQWENKNQMRSTLKFNEPLTSWTSENAKVLFLLTTSVKQKRWLDMYIDVFCSIGNKSWNENEYEQFVCRIDWFTRWDSSYDFHKAEQYSCTLFFAWCEWSYWLRVIQDPIFTTRLNFLRWSSDELIHMFSSKIIHTRFCLEILPEISSNIRWLDLESSSMRHILCAAHYPNLSGLGLYNVTKYQAQCLFSR